MFRLHDATHALMLSFMLCAAGVGMPAIGGTGGSDNTAPPGAPVSPEPSRSVEAFISGDTTANQLELAADYALRNGRYDQAIELCRRALRKTDNDLDIHKSYAEALEAKLAKEGSENTDLFNACLREWLIVLRTERGPEKLPNFHGITVPGYGHLYKDEEYEMAARYHIRELTGTTPRGWEPDNMFLKRVGKGTSSTVTGKLIKSKQSPPRHAEDKGQAPSLKPGKAADSLDWLKQ